MTADAVFFGAHPDDVELTCGGLAALLASHGHSVVVVDLTRGERASRGTVEERSAEAADAAKALGVRGRENLALPDLGIDRRDPAQLAAVVGVMRRLRPALVVAPDDDDPHPDHVEGHHLVSRACYAAGLARYEAGGGRHRPSRILFALYRTMRRPDVIVDISSTWSQRMQALRAHRSQLAGTPGPETYLTAAGFLEQVEARARTYGAAIGAAYGEGYRTRAPLALRDARVLIDHGAAA